MFSIFKRKRTPVAPPATTTTAVAPLTTKPTTQTATSAVNPPAKPVTTITRQPTEFERRKAVHAEMKDDGLSKVRDLPGMDRLLDILGYNRNANSPGIKAFLTRYLTFGFDKDAYGNRFFSIPQKDGSDPRIAFTSHCDTMSDDRLSIYHQVMYNKTNDVLFRRNGECLGADDGTGVWLMLEMIDAKIPGLYCFYLDEETGREGSKWSWVHNKDRYQHIDTVISFDRMNTGDIIATQRGSRCCSTEFQDELAKLLGGNYKPGARGSFTDSATFMDDLPECTNISVGYFNQHTDMETQNVTHALWLRDRLVTIGGEFHTKLPVKRDPEDDKFVPASYSYGNYGSYTPPKPRNKEIWDNYPDHFGIPDDTSNQEDDDWGLDDSDVQALMGMEDGAWDVFCRVSTPAERLTLICGNMDDLISDFGESVICALVETGFANQLTAQHLVDYYPDIVSELFAAADWTSAELSEYIAMDLYGIEDIRNAGIDATH